MPRLTCHFFGELPDDDPITRRSVPARKLWVMSEGLHRVLVEKVRLGYSQLGAEPMRHLVRVLRLGEGDLVRVFDAAGGTGEGVLREIEGKWTIEVGKVDGERAGGVRVEIASAVPKGDRADWMVEKLSELGVARWVPLRTERSVVHPEGVEKFNRWRRLSEQAARQCGRAGVMEVAEMEGLGAYAAGRGGKLGLFASLEGAGAGWPALPGEGGEGGGVAIVIGPEGDFSPAEMAMMNGAGWVAVGLGDTVLRVETAAMVAAVLAGGGRARLVSGA